MDIPTYEEFLKQLKFNLRLIGTPYGDSRVYFSYYILLFQIILMIIMEGSFLISKIAPENFLDVMQLFPCTSIGILSVLKMLALTQKRKKILDLTECLGKLYKDIYEDDTKRVLVRKNMVLVILLMKYNFILNIVLISVYNFASPFLMAYYYFIKSEVVFLLPFAVLVPFSTDSWLPWTAVYLYSCLSGFICVLFFTTVDGFYFVLTSHICINFSVISDKIERLEPNSVNLLPQIVKEHQYILKLGEDLEDIFTAPNLFNVLVGSLEICALGFNLTNGTWERMPGCILFLSSVILQILMMSVFGENLIRESVKIGDTAFLCKWYEMDEKSKKTILTIILRSQKPQQLTAYKFSTISYSSFTKIISTSWSYFTILKTVYTPPEATQVQQN